MSDEHRELDLRKAARLLAQIILDESVLGAAADLSRDGSGRYVPSADAGATGPAPVPLQKTREDYALDLYALLHGESVTHRGSQVWPE